MAVRADRRSQLRLKRYVDVIGAAFAVVLFFPLFVVAAAAVLLDSPGPVFFRQKRIGMGGRPFDMWKFRTMVRDAPTDPHRDFIRANATATALPDPSGIHKLTDDPRVTRVGRWLRKTSLDELPQLINVLRGDMSLVGPRPPILYEYEAYESWQLERLQVPQGMSGLWQVSGRNRLSYLEMHQLDLEYVRTWSPLLDLKILARTLPAVVFDLRRAA
jgi:lipopolysaccharide/colanic/teichoic acid biosynthesis glycosyltransferase